MTDRASVLKLQRDGSPPHDGLINLKSKTAVYVVIPPGYYNMDTLVVTTNCIPDETGRFDRQSYNRVNGTDDWDSVKSLLQNNGHAEGVCSECIDAGDWTGMFAVNLAGGFELRVDGCAIGSDESSSSVCRFMCNPQLTSRPGVDLPLDSISMISHLTPCLGSIDEWQDMFKCVSALGYNMVHFTPIQEVSQYI